MGVQAQQSEIRISLGGSASLPKLNHAFLSLGGKTKTNKSMKYFDNNPKGQTYETLKAEIIEIEAQGVLCSSVDGTRGGTESMNMIDINWP